MNTTRLVRIGAVELPTTEEQSDGLVKEVIVSEDRDRDERQRSADMKEEKAPIVKD